MSSLNNEDASTPDAPESDEDVPEWLLPDRPKSAGGGSEGGEKSGGDGGEGAGSGLEAPAWRSFTDVVEILGRLPKFDGNMMPWFRGMTEAYQQQLDATREASVLDSYFSGTLCTHPLALICVEEDVADGPRQLLCVQMLQYALEAVGVQVTVLYLPEAAVLPRCLARFSSLLMCCTSRLAERVSSDQCYRATLQEFAAANGKSSLHSLLCEGSFQDTFLRILPSNFLVRSFQAVWAMADPVVALTSFVDVVTELSGTQGIGVIPDLLALASKERQLARGTYAAVLARFHDTEGRIFVQSRLSSATVSAFENSSSRSQYDAVTWPSPLLSNNNDQGGAGAGAGAGGGGGGMVPTIEGFLTSAVTKVQLFLCASPAETQLVGLYLANYLLRRRSAPVLCVDCSPASFEDCILRSWSALSLTPRHLDEARRLGLVLVFQNYHNLGSYANILQANRFSLSGQMKVFAVCDSNFFRRRGYLRCFLPDDSNRPIEQLDVVQIPSFYSAPKASPLTGGSALSRWSKVKNTINLVSLVRETKPHRAKPKRTLAVLSELSWFLNWARERCVDGGVLSSRMERNPQFFISYAWEADPEALQRQQEHLCRIVEDFATLGISVWLDIQRMTGDINLQMDTNIRDSRVVLLIATPRYSARTLIESNVKKEFDLIAERLRTDGGPAGGFSVFLLHFLDGTDEQPAFPADFHEHPLRCDFRAIDSAPSYLRQMLHPEHGLIPAILRLLAPAEFGAFGPQYASIFAQFEANLMQQVVAKHLIHTRNQEDIHSLDIVNRLSGYISPFGLPHEAAPLTQRFPLQSRFESFLKDPAHKSLMLLGAAGSGKSLFLAAVFSRMIEPWQHLGTSTHHPFAVLPEWLPLYLQLKFFNDQYASLDEFLQSYYQLEPPDLQALKVGFGRGQKALVILDGFDELSPAIRPKVVSAMKDWLWAKFLIGSRPDIFHHQIASLSSSTSTSTSSSSSTTSTSSSSSSSSSVLQPNNQDTVFLSPFSPEDIQHYCAHHDAQKSLVVGSYHQLVAIPGMNLFLANPFLLTLSLQCLPQLMRDRTLNHRRHAITRAEIFQAFVCTWFEQETRCRELSTEACLTFCEDLSQMMFLIGVLGLPSQQPPESSPERPLWAFFFDPDNSPCQDAAPLRHSGGFYTFLHKSLLEFFLAKMFVRSLASGAADVARLWGHKLLPRDERNVMLFLGDLVRLDRITLGFHSISQPSFAGSLAQSLLHLATSTRDRAAAAASILDEISPLCANALSVLNYADVSLAGADLHGLALPGADLQKACLAAADLRGCLLAGSVLGRPAGVKLQGANLDGAVLDGALLGLGVDLGEYPSLLGHTDAVTSLCFDPRQQLLVSGSLDASIRVWDPAAGPVGQLGAGSNLQKISAIAVQGGRLASAGYDKAIQLWDIDSGEMVAAFRGHNGLICCLLFLSDTELVSGSNDQSLLVWNTSTGQSRPLLGHAGGVWCCSFSPSSGLLSGSSDHAIRLWNLRTSSCESTFIGHTQAVTSVQFAPGGKVFASGSLDRTIYLWSLLRGTPDRTLRVEAGGRINALLFLDSVTLFSGGSDRLIRVWDTETGLCQRSYEGHDWPVASLALHSDGKTLFSGSDDGTIRCWDLETDSCEKTFESHRALVSSVSFTPAGDRLLTASWDKEVRVWELSSLLCVASFSSAKSPINVAKFSSDGNSVFAGTQSNLVYIWSLQLSNNSFNNSNNINNNAEVILQGHNAPINDLVECRNGTLVSCADDRLLIRWSLQTKAKVGVLEGHTEAVSSLAYHPLAEMLASGSSDRTVRIWDLATDQCLRKIVLHSPHAEEVSAVCWDLTGARLLFASCIGEAENTVLRVWNADSLAFESVVQQPHPRRVSAIRQLPDGRVATCSWDRSVKLWESDFSHPQALEGHFGRVWSLDVHPDGLRLVTGSWDQTFRLWAVPPRRSTAAAALLSSQHHHSLRTALQQAHIPLTEDELFSLLPKLASLASLASLTPALAPLACLTSLQRLPLGLVCPTSNPKAESDSDPILRGHMIWQSAPHILSFKGARAVGLENAPVATMQLIQQRGAECEEEAAAEEKGEPPAERRMNMRKMMSASLVLGSSSGGMEARASVAQVLKQPETVKTITAEVTVESVAKFSHVLRIRERSREGDAASSSSSAAAGRAAADSQLNVGDINVVKQLSRGLALGSINGQMVTLRTLSKQDLQPRDQAQMRAVDQVRHVNLVANLTVHATEDFVQIVRPHLRSSLPEAMAKGKLALVVKLRVLRQVAFGLMWLHQNGFQHCNLSFENVLLASEDLSQIAVQLSDYGWPHLAGVLESGGWDARLARVPPEALRSCFQIYTPASDVYAMGMLLYELLTERPVFPECGSLAALKALVVDKLESPQVPQDFPPRLEEVLRRSWAADPSLRPGLEEMVREMDVLICEASVADVLGRKFWRDTFIIGGQIQEEVEWSVFLKAFCEFLGSPMTKEIFSSAGYLKALLCGLDGPSAAQEKVSVERFGKILSWLGPLQGVGIMSEVKELLSKPWFHGFISADDVNNSLKGKQPGTFLLRFSSEPGCYAISAMARDGIKNFRIAHKPGGPYIIGQAQLKSLSEIVSTYSESLGMLTPCPGSPYRDINLSKHSSRSYIIPEWEE